MSTERGSYRDGSWQQRVTVLGDPGEKAFERWADSAGLRWERMGWNRPAPSLKKWPAALRSMPDYAVHDRVIEVVGHGQDGTLKLREPKVTSLDRWAEFLEGFPLHVWVYDSHRELCAELPWAELKAAIEDVGWDGQFREGTPYRAVRTDALSVEWRPVPPE
jgi:hypothetical protein